MNQAKPLILYIVVSALLAAATCYTLKTTGQSASIISFFFFVPLQFIAYLFFASRWGRSSVDWKYAVVTLASLLITEWVFYIDLAINVGASRIV